MTAPVQPQTANTTSSTENGAPNTSGTPSAPGTTPSSQPHATSGQFTHQPNEWRYPADYSAEYLRGKTAEEAAQVLDRLYRQSLSQQPQRPQYQQPTPQPQSFQQPQQFGLPDDTEFLTNPRTAFERGAQTFYQQNINPQLEAVIQSNAATNRAIVQQKHNDLFKRFGPELAYEMNRVEARYQTIENLETIADMVRGRHVSELAREQVEAEIQRRQSANGGGMRPDGSVSGPGPSIEPSGLIDFNKLPDVQQQILRATFTTEKTFAEFARKYWGPDCDVQQKAKEWVEKSLKGGVITDAKLNASGPTDAPRPGYQMTRQAAR